VCIFIGSQYSYSEHQEDFFLFVFMTVFGLVWNPQNISKYFYSGYYLYRCSFNFSSKLALKSNMWTHHGLRSCLNLTSLFLKRPDISCNVIKFALLHLLLLIKFVILFAFFCEHNPKSNQPNSHNFPFFFSTVVVIAQFFLVKICISSYIHI
jgi:hypothetical protein